MKNWNKYKDFSPEEFECNCGCGLCKVSEIMVSTLQVARNISREITKKEFGHDRGVSFRIERGCSCANHNSTIKGNSPTSSHIADEDKDIECTAIDLKCRNSQERYIILMSLLLAGFNRIGLYAHNGIHADVDESKVQGSVWKK